MRINALIIMLWGAISTNAQLPQSTIDYWIDYWNSSEENSNEFNYYDLLEYYYYHKIQFSNANANSLSESPFFTEAQILEISTYLKQYKQFVSVYELQQIKSIDRDMLIHLIPFINTLNYQSSPSSVHKLRFQYKKTSPRSKGYTDSIYLGKPNYFNLNYTHTSQHLSIGFRLEKDAGEPLLSQSEFPGTDFSSAYLLVKDIGIIKKIIIGHFGFSSGEGLCFSTNSFIGSSTGLEIIKRGSRGLEPYSSNRENNALKGIGLQLLSKAISLNLFYSNTLNDASVSEHEISALREGSGLHRSHSERKQQDRLNESTLGAQLHWQFKNLGISLTSISKLLSANHKSDRLDKLFDFSGSQYNKHSLAYEYFVKNRLFYGELCIDNKGRIGQIYGMSSTFGRNLDFAILYRLYDPGFITYQSTPFSRNSNFAGEQGLYSNIRLSKGKFVISGYTDNFLKSWISYTLGGLSHAHQWGFDLEYTRRKQFKIKIRILERAHNAELHNNRQWKIEKLKSMQFRLHLDYHLSKSMELRGRIQMNRSNQLMSYFMYTELISKVDNIRAGQLSLRISKAIIPSSNLSISSYERSAPGMYPYAILTQDLFYYYILFKFSLRPNVKVWIKWNATYYDKELQVYKQTEKNGSGLEERIGNRKNTFAFQIQYLLE